MHSKNKAYVNKIQIANNKFIKNHLSLFDSKTVATISSIGASQVD